MKRFSSVFGLLVLFVGAAFAQVGPVHVDPGSLSTYDGTVKSINFVQGAGQPSFILEVAGLSMQIQTGPFWLFETTDFTLTQGDQVSVDAFKSLDPTVVIYYAGVIRNTTTGKTFNLRDSSGLPLWTGGHHGQGGSGNGGGSGQGGSGNGGGNGQGGCGNGGGNGQGGSGNGGGSGQGGSGNGGGCGNGQGGGRGSNGGGSACGNGGGNGVCIQSGGQVDMTKESTETGTVKSTAFSLGQKGSWFVLAASGADFTVYPGPVWFLAANDFTVVVGYALEVVMAPYVSNPSAFAAIQIKNSTTGNTIELRDENGVPLWWR